MHTSQDVQAWLSGFRHNYYYFFLDLVYNFIALLSRDSAPAAANDLSNCDRCRTDLQM